MKNTIKFFGVVALAVLIGFPQMAFGQSSDIFFANLNLSRDIPPADVLMTSGGANWGILYPIITGVGVDYQGWSSNGEWWITFYWSNKTKADYDNLVLLLRQSGLNLVADRSSDHGWEADFSGD